jgi:hypothetical protein
MQCRYTKRRLSVMLGHPAQDISFPDSSNAGLHLANNFAREADMATGTNIAFKIQLAVGSH